jgi:tetratricopeptide (TPR) repeat protein
MPPRLDLDSLSDDELYARGVAAARVGETDEARALLEELTRRDPGRPDAWLWRASVESEPKDKRDCFRKVLELRPDDADAKSGLDRLVAKYGQGILAPDEVMEPLHCYWHPERETMLRCTRCGRPICPACARPHPVGWRCKECARELRSPLYKVRPAELARGLVLGIAVSAGLAVVVGVAGALVGLVAAAAAVVGGAAVVWAALAFLPVPAQPVTLLLYAAVGAAVAYSRLR